MTFKPSQNGAMTNIGFAMATINAFVDRMGEGRIDDVCANAGAGKRKGASENEHGGSTIQFVEAPERPPLSPEGKLQAALIMSAIEDSFRLTPLIGTEWYNKELYLKRHEKFAKRWLRGETGTGHNRDNGNEVECYSAKECFETVGIDYRKAIAKLESAWLKHRQTGESVVKKTRRAMSGTKTTMTVNE